MIAHRLVLLGYCILLVSGAPHCEKPPTGPECGRCPKNLITTGDACEAGGTCTDPNEFKYTGGGSECMNFEVTCASDKYYVGFATTYSVLSKYQLNVPGVWTLTCNSTGWTVQSDAIMITDRLTTVRCCDNCLSGG